MRTSMVYGLLAVAVGSIACGSATSGVQTAYNATINGFYVVPGDSSTGSASLVLNVSGLTASGTLTIGGSAPGGTVNGVANAYTVGHIHVGASGSNGAVVLNLCGTAGDADSATTGQKATPACTPGSVINFSYTAGSTSQLLPGATGNTVCGGTVAAPVACPSFGTFVANVETEGYYAQVHSTLHPAGEIRGQILRTAQTF